MNRICNNYPVVSLRPNLEYKKDGRRKMRLILQGFKEPEEWDLGPISSPVAKLSTVRGMIFRSDRGAHEEVISMIDISYAFLQSNKYSDDDEPRYVSLKASKDSARHREIGY